MAHSEEQALRVNGRVVRQGDQEAQPELATAHDDRVRPLCMCQRDGVAMYIARIPDPDGGMRYVVKRMPDTGPLHAPQCASYVPPPGISGFGQLLGTAISEGPDGRTALRLGFPMDMLDWAAPTPTAMVDPSGSVQADPSRLTLRAVLHYLWHEAGLASWTPAMAGKRNWRVVSWHLRQAAQGMYLRSRPLTDRLFVPEPFQAERKAEITARRLAAWAPAQTSGAHGRKLMMLVGEVKAIEAARYGRQLVIKHLPDAPFMLDDRLHVRLTWRFAAELDLWQSDPDGHLIAISTFAVGRGGLATVEEISLVTVDRHWLPYETEADRMLVELAVEQRRRFTKSLRCNLTDGLPIASLTLTDTTVATAAFVLAEATQVPEAEDAAAAAGLDAWIWALGSPIPRLPDRSRVTATPDGADRGAVVYRRRQLRASL
ncbi:DUF1173 domain-containing protein [Nocardioides sp. NPDC087217]|uniref:DUF1173 domain-containing protein n=1 Tax=Nocardioides sp. NPDC087217 TaxID=3364335 RepID=UPI0038145999